MLLFWSIIAASLHLDKGCIGLSATKCKPAFNQSHMTSQVLKHLTKVLIVITIVKKKKA